MNHDPAPAGGQQPPDRSEVAPGPECFKGTTIPRLAAADSDWLEIVAQPSVIVDEQFIEKLNGYVDVAREPLLAIELAGKMRTGNFVYQNLTPQEAIARASGKFYSSLMPAREQNEIRSGVIVAHDTGTSPLKFIQLTRLLHDIVGSNLDQLLVRGPLIYTRGIETTRRRISLMQEVGINPAHVLNGTPNTLCNKNTTNDGRFLQAARKAERDYLAQVGRAAQGAAALAVPRPRPVELPPNPERYARMSETTGLEVGLLQSAYPNLGSMHVNTFNTLLAKAEELVDRIRDRDLRLRDLMSLIPPVSEKPDKEPPAAK